MVHYNTSITISTVVLVLYLLRVLTTPTSYQLLPVRIIQYSTPSFSSCFNSRSTKLILLTATGTNHIMFNTITVSIPDPEN